MSIVRSLVLSAACAVVVGCNPPPPPPPPHPPQVTVVCKRDWYGTVVCNRSVSH